MVATSGEITASVWIVLGLGGGIGVLSGLLGVGGGFLLMPAMMYRLGIPATVAVGTDILQITISGAYGAFVYAQAGAVALPLAGDRSSLGVHLVPVLVLERPNWSTKPSKATSPRCYWRGVSQSQPKN